MSKLTPRQDRFCRQFVECANAAGAARAAGYTPRSARTTGYRLLRQPVVAQRIAQLQAETAHAHCRDVEFLLGKLEAVFRHSFEDHQYATAARVVELQARLARLAAESLLAGTNEPQPSDESPPASNDNEPPLPGSD